MKLYISKTYSLDSAREALIAVEKGHPVDKIVLTANRERNTMMPVNGESTGFALGPLCATKRLKPEQLGAYPCRPTISDASISSAKAVDAESNQ
jgi:hypothetical protein